MSRISTDSGFQDGQDGLGKGYMGRLEERKPILGIIGVLQFDMVDARLCDEYGVNYRVDCLSYTASRWVQAGPNHGSLTLPSSVMETRDRTGRAVLLFPCAER
jgi:peptide subunit release factor RF-3